MSTLSFMTCSMILGGMISLADLLIRGIRRMHTVKASLKA